MAALILAIRVIETMISGIRDRLDMVAIKCRVDLVDHPQEVFRCCPMISDKVQGQDEAEEDQTMVDHRNPSSQTVTQTTTGANIRQKATRH